MQSFWFPFRFPRIWHTFLFWGPMIYKRSALMHTQMGVFIGLAINVVFGVLRFIN